MSYQPYEYRLIRQAGVILNTASGTNLTTVAATAANGTRWDTLQVTTDSVTDLELLVYACTPTNDWLLGSVPVPAGAGHGAVARVDVMPAIGVASHPWLPLIFGVTLKVALQSALAAGKVAHVVAFGGDY